MKKYYKLAKPDGFDWYTGKTINYRESIGKIVTVPKPNLMIKWYTSKNETVFDPYCGSGTTLVEAKK